MTDPDNVVSAQDIEASNVRPAFEASLRCGATEPELASKIGWTRSHLEARDATVSGESTYQHMELMYKKKDYSQFVLAATAAHSLSSLGVVGLACKTVATVGEAMRCHRRYQHLTNRTASYDTTIQDGHLILSEERFGHIRPGSVLISDYTMFVALHLLRLIGEHPPTVVAMHSRRTAIPSEELGRYEKFLGAKIHLGAPHCQLWLDAEIANTKILSADAELSSYLNQLLLQKEPHADDEPVLRDVRNAIGEQLLHGTPTAQQIARSLGLGQRTLQRRLAVQNTSFTDVLESTRRTLAEAHLAEGLLSLTEVAYILGYSEQASFFRAFRRWSNMTPSEYRRIHAP